MKKKVFISTAPFCEYSDIPLQLLQAEKEIEFTVNPYGRKLSEDELSNLIEPYSAIIAGTESISAQVLARGKNLKVIARVGVGLDSVDLLEAKKRNIAVAYTPEAPAPAVAELTLGLTLNLLRKIWLSDSMMHQGKWKRHFGGRIEKSIIGLIGCGRIGSRVAKLLHGFSPQKILVHDLNKINLPFVEQVDLKTLLSQSDVISLHTPLTKKTVDLITKISFQQMKTSALLINTARGGIINEQDLFSALSTKQIQAAAVDVFEKEPYEGPLSKLDNCILTSHMGSMSFDCRAQMEIEATKDVIRFLTGQQLLQPVPESEYELKRS